MSQGRILYASPERLRIEYQRPAGELVLLPGDGTLVTRKPGRPTTSRSIDRLDERTRRSLGLLLSLFEGKLPAGFPLAKIEARRAGGNRVIVTMYRESAFPNGDQRRLRQSRDDPGVAESRPRRGQHPAGRHV